MEDIGLELRDGYVYSIVLNTLRPDVCSISQEEALILPPEELVARVIRFADQLQINNGPLIVAGDILKVYFVFLLSLFAVIIIILLVLYHY